MVAHKGFRMELDAIMQILPWKPSSELISGEVVYNRVKARIKTSKTQGNRVKYENHPSGSAAFNFIGLDQEI